MKIFQDSQDYSVFLNLLKRHLSKKPIKDNKGREYPWFAKQISLEAFCLMPNHLHLLLYQTDQTGLTQLMQSIMPAYVRYFNKKYHRYGPLFQGIYKASMIYTDSYLDHISRYIHLNPKNYKTYKWSSLPYYTSNKKAEWLEPGRIRGMFKTNREYEEFMADYAEYKEILDEIKHELADQKSYN